ADVPARAPRSVGRGLPRGGHGRIRPAAPAGLGRAGVRLPSRRLDHTPRRRRVGVGSRTRTALASRSPAGRRRPRARAHPRRDAPAAARRARRTEDRTHARSKEENPMTDTSTRYLAGNFAPVRAEVRAHDLRVPGTIPRELVGRFLRIGPNPLPNEDAASYHWFTGPGMVHGVRLRDGRAEWYRRRWVRSDRVC